jgi:DNA transposition AAA+ family ATPase
VPSNLATSKPLLKFLQEKTGGKVGHLDRTLRKAAILALRKGANKIDRKILDEVVAYFN